MLGYSFIKTVLVTKWLCGYSHQNEILVIKKYLTMFHPDVKTHILDAKKLSLYVRGRLENGRHLGFSNGHFGRLLNGSRPNYNTEIGA